MRMSPSFEQLATPIKWFLYGSVAVQPSEAFCGSRRGAFGKLRCMGAQGVTTPHQATPLADQRARGVIGCAASAGLAQT
jgi:hypothetical protein